MFIPLPFFGPSGFLPKIIIMVSGCIVIDIFYHFLKKNQRIACIVSSMGAGLVVTPVQIGFFILFGLPSAERIISLAIPFIFLGLIEAILGGFCAYLIYQKIKNKTFVKQIQS